MNKTLGKELTFPFVFTAAFLISHSLAATDLLERGLSDLEGAHAVSINQLRQHVTQGLDAGAMAGPAADITFDDLSFSAQNGNVNNISSGLNTAQQGAVALVINGESGQLTVQNSAAAPAGGAVAVNDLRQVASQSFTLGSVPLDVGTRYSGSITFGSDSFRNQQFNVNSINSGINAVQQGAVAVSMTGMAANVPNPALLLPF